MVVVWGTGGGVKAVSVWGVWFGLRCVLRWFAFCLFLCFGSATSPCLDGVHTYTTDVLSSNFVCTFEGEGKQVWFPRWVGHS